MEKQDPMEEQDEFEIRYIHKKKVEYFNGKPVQYFDVEERFAEKESQRLRDRLAVERGEITADEMYKRNSIWTGLDWSRVTVIEPSGLTWKPVEINNAPVVEEWFEFGRGGKK